MYLSSSTIHTSTSTSTHLRIHASTPRCFSSSLNEIFEISEFQNFRFLRFLVRCVQEDPKKQKMLFTRHKTHSILSRFVSRRSLSNKNDEWLKAAQKELRGRDVSEVRALENVDVVASLSLSLWKLSYLLLKT